MAWNAAKMTAADFDTYRRDNRVTSREIADRAGCTVRCMLEVETRQVVVEQWMVDVLNQIISERAA